MKLRTVTITVADNAISLSKRLVNLANNIKNQEGKL